ncbi:hypothetical protein MPNT_40142 [Candidatus Methylacidithermus pantelleriae]|uniref:Uncharacterized protein n=1 Tax=Candidatus Methylacidithermus pantelleriae TaxID=2744239 RepID=A0A8J2FTA7_9BACT|nr:hypothetical protein MPNT_40142 [Candidatus Methylacidithermus pantelleriae]
MFRTIQSCSDFPNGSLTQDQESHFGTPIFSHAFSKSNRAGWPNPVLPFRGKEINQFRAAKSTPFCLPNLAALLCTNIKSRIPALATAPSSQETFLLESSLLSPLVQDGPLELTWVDCRFS